MDGLYEMTAAGVPVQLAGETFYLRPLRMVDWGEASRFINQRRKPPLDVVKEFLPHLDEQGKRELLELAWREARTADFLPAYEIERWFATSEGQVYKLWMQLRQSHPHLTLESTDDLLRQSQLQELATLEKQRQADNGTEAGFTSRPEATPGTTAASASPSPGEPSSEVSANGTALAPSR